MKDKVVIITGASSGIGRSLAYRFGAAGSKVILAARTLSKLEAIAHDIASAGGEAIAVQTDVSDADACQELIDITVRKYGRIDILINNAGISMRALFIDLELTVLERLMRVNFWGLVHCTKAALPYLVESKGIIVGVSSVAGSRGLPGRSGYSASKFAVNGFLEALRLEVARKGVHILVACPGYTRSNIRMRALTADGNMQGESTVTEEKLMSSDRVADAIYRAIIKRKRSLLLTFQGWLMVTMNKIAPRLVDRRVYRHYRKERNPLI